MMDKPELLRAYDMLIGMLASYDNQGVRTGFTELTQEAIEQVRGLILNMDDVPQEKAE